MITLRPYQDRGVSEVRAAFMEGHRAVLLQMPTGGGKTLTAAHIQQSAAALGNDSMFICNRVELVEQTAKAFMRLDQPFGLIAAGYSANPRETVQIASIDTLKRRLTKVRPPRLIVWDECRGLGAKGWTDVFNAFPDAIHLGLDATPIRLDGQGLDKFFTHLVHGPTYSELMAIGALVPFDVYAPGVPDLEGIKTKMGDFDQEQLGDLMDKPQLVGDVIRHYQELTPGKLGITFAVNRKHSEHLAEQYRAAGIPAMHLDGDTDKGERKAVVAAFRRREVLVLTNVNLFSAGFDVPGVEVITDCAPTKSLAMYLQRAGRGSRPDEENPHKTRCTLLDHAGNVFRHGLPDSDRTWTLEGKEKRGAKKKVEEPTLAVRQCVECFAVFMPQPSCPNCGCVQPVANRELAHNDGILQKIDPAGMKMLELARKKELKAAKTLEELEALGIERGYSPDWAKNTFNSRAAGRAKAISEYVSNKIAEQQAKAYLRDYQ